MSTLSPFQTTTLNPTCFDHHYRELGPEFFQSTNPVPVAKPGLIRFNRELADELGLTGTEMGAPDSVEVFAGNRVPQGAQPLAAAYAGHQFGHFNPQLGDGRAILLGEIKAPDGKRYDLQLKGSGPTAWSRGGDGRSALGPVLREYLVSEAMAQLGVPTTRALAAVTSGEQVARERLVAGGILTRVASSFVRVGSFQYFANQGNIRAIQRLADHVIARNYPQIEDSERRYADLLAAVVDRQASLIAQWMQLGFIHGVMNTDNMSIAGETIDYGPCAFIDGYHHDQVFSSIDRQGRYAYRQQPTIGLWNLTRLAETLVPLMAPDSDTGIEMATQILKGYEGLYDQYWLEGMRAKLGLSAQAARAAGDHALVTNLLDIMSASQADFTLSFYYLSRMGSKADHPGTSAERDFYALFDKPGAATPGTAPEAAPRAIKSWCQQWRTRLNSEPHSDAERQATMQQVNPVIIPRNHRIESIIRAAEDEGDFTPFHQLHEALQEPWADTAESRIWQQAPRPQELVTQTFCGT